MLPSTFNGRIKRLPHSHNSTWPVKQILPCGMLHRIGGLIPSEPHTFHTTYWSDLSVTAGLTFCISLNSGSELKKSGWVWGFSNYEMYVESQPRMSSWTWRQGRLPENLMSNSYFIILEFMFVQLFMNECAWVNGTCLNENVCHLSFINVEF